MTTEPKFHFETRQDADGFWRCRILHTSMLIVYGEAIAADEAMALERAKAMAAGLEQAYDPESYYTRQRQFMSELSKGFDDAMGRLEDLMMRDDGQAYSETERVMPRLRELRRAALHVNHEFRQ